MPRKARSYSTTNVNWWSEISVCVHQKLGKSIGKDLSKDFTDGV